MFKSEAPPSPGYDTAPQIEQEAGKGGASGDAVEGPVAPEQELEEAWTPLGPRATAPGHIRS